MIKKYNLLIVATSGFRVPLNFSIKILDYYSDKIYVKNTLYCNCSDEYIKRFINKCFTDKQINNLNQGDERNYFNRYLKKYNIDLYKISNYEIINIDNNNNKPDIHHVGIDEKYFFDTKTQLIKIIDPQYQGKMSLLDKEEFSSEKVNLYSYPFIKNYLFNSKRLDKILRNPNNLLNSFTEV